MLKVKDGYAKVIGTTVNGSSDYLLLSNGGEQKLSDLTPFNAVKFGYNDTTNIWHCILKFTSNWIGSVTFMYSPIECQRDYWCLGNINLRDTSIYFYIVNFSNNLTSLFKVTAEKNTSSNTYDVKLWVKNSNSSNQNPYGLIQVLAYNNVTITGVGNIGEASSAEPTGTYNATPANNFKDYFKAGSNISLTSANNIITISATNTWRNILVKGNSIGSANLNLKAGSNISLTQSGGDVTISSTNSWRTIKGNNNSIGSNALNITGDGVTIIPYTGTGEIKVQLTGDVTTHTHDTQYIKKVGDLPISAYDVIITPTSLSGSDYTDTGGGIHVKAHTGTQFQLWLHDTSNVWYKKTGTGSWRKMDAGCADQLMTARNINGTSFNGTADITTANWGTARNITIGSTTRTVDGSTDVTWTLSDIGAAAISHNHTSLSNVEKISFKSDASDSCYIATTISNSATYLDFYLSDDSAQEKFRWIFKDCNSNIGEKTIMELSPTNRAATALKLYDNYVAVYGSSQQESGLMYRNGGYIGVSASSVTAATASNTKVTGDWEVLCMHAISTYDTTTSKATLSYEYQLKSEFPKATVATKLSSNAGSATQPIYFSEGKPLACNYALNKSVPAEAVFTDTTYDLTIGTKNATNSETKCTNGNVYLNLLKNSSSNKWCLLKGTNATTVTYDGSGTITINSNNTWRDVIVKGTSIGTNSLQLIAGTGISLSVDTGKVTIANTVSQRSVTNTYDNSSNQSETSALTQKGAYALYLNSFNCKKTGVKSGDASSDTMGSVTWSGALPSSLTESGWDPYNYGEVLSFPASNIRFDIYASNKSSSTDTNNGIYYRTGYNSSSKTEYEKWAKIIDSNTIKSYFNSSWNYDKPSMPKSLLPYINDNGVTSIGKTLNFFTGGSSPSYTQLVAQEGSGESNTLTLPKTTGTVALTSQISNAQVCRIYYISGSGPIITEGTGNQTDVSPSLTKVNDDQRLFFDTGIKYEDNYWKKYFLMVSPNYEIGAGTGIAYDTDIKAALIENSKSTLAVDIRFGYTGDSNTVAFTIAIFQINKLN